MRLEILNSGYTFGTKVLFAFIQLASRRPVPDAAKLVFYRADFYGDTMKKVTHEAMRGPSAWSVGDRELMALLSRRRMSASSALVRTLQLQPGRITIKRGSQPCFPTLKQ